MSVERRIEGLDYLAIAVLLCCSIGIGVFYAVRDRTKKSTANYFLARRKLSALPTALSYIVTYQSSILFLGLPGEGFAYGITYIFSTLGMVLAQILIILLLLPFLHSLKLNSINEYYLLRFKSRTIQCGAGVVAALIFLVYMSVVLLGSTVAFEFMTGSPSWIFRLVFVITVVMYTSIGGLKAIVWTDIIQLCVMLFSIGAITVTGIVGSGGLTNVFRLGEERLTVIHISLNPTRRHTVWYLMTYHFILLMYRPISPAGFQRIASMPNTQTARRSFIISSLLYCPIFIFAVFQGVIAFAYFSNTGCDPVASGAIKNINEVVPFLVLQLFRDAPGVRGVILAGLLSASLSTMSSCLGGISFTVVEDIVKPSQPNLSEKQASIIAKLTVVAIGVISIVLSHAMTSLNVPLHQVIGVISSSLYGPSVGLFLFSASYKRARPFGIIAGFAFGVAFCMWLSYGRVFFTSRSTSSLTAGPTYRCQYDGQTNTSYPNAFSTSTVPYWLKTSVETDANIDSGFINKTVEVAVTGAKLSSFLRAIYSISYLLPSVIGLVVSTSVAFLISCLCGSKEVSVDEKLIFRAFRKRQDTRITHNQETEGFTRSPQNDY